MDAAAEPLRELVKSVMVSFQRVFPVVLPQPAVCRRARMEGCVSGLNSVCANQGPRAKPVR